MTNLTGQTFISYKSEQKETATALKKSLHEHGIRTWQDIDDLSPEPTDSALRNAIRDDDVTDAVILVSEGVKESDAILKIEVPEIVEKDRKEDDFSIVIATCPDLNSNIPDDTTIYEYSAEILDNADTNFGRFVERNMEKITDKGTSPSHCDDVANTVLKSRLRSADKHLTGDDSLQCSLDTYSVTHAEKPVIKIDWSHRFGDTLPSESVWNGRFVPTLRSVIDTIHEMVPGQDINFRGNAKLSAAFSLGFITRDVANVNASWTQGSLYSDEEELWDVSVEPSRIDVQILRDPGSTNSDGAILMSISDDVSKISLNNSDNAKFGSSIEIKSENFEANIGRAQASGIAREFRSIIKEFSREHRDLEKIHLFISSPVGLAFLMGTVANGLPDIQTYALETSDGPKRYKTAALLSNKH